MQSPMMIEVSPKWVSLIRSPLMWLVWALQGISISFAPLFLYWSGKGSFFPELRWIVVPVCFAVICLEGLFFISLANHVVGQVRRPRDTR